MSGTAKMLTDIMFIQEDFDFSIMRFLRVDS